MLFCLSPNLISWLPQLETALAAESRKLNSSSESEDYTRTRPRRGGRKPRKARANSSLSNTESEFVRQRVDSISAATETTATDTEMRLRSSSVASETQDSRPLRKISSGVSLSATPRSPPMAPIPNTPALTLSGMATTDDEDMSDFQSAYSVSPRDSYNENTDGKNILQVRTSISDGEERGTPTAMNTEQFRTQQNLMSLPRDRSASNATAIDVGRGTTTS